MKHLLCKCQRFTFWFLGLVCSKQNYSNSGSAVTAAAVYSELFISKKSFKVETVERQKTERNRIHSGTRNQWRSRMSGVMHSERLAEKTSRAAVLRTD